MSLLDKASLIVTPNSYKESKLYSVVPNTTLGDMDVVRATTATRVNSAGLIEVVPRNLFQYSEAISTSPWALVRATVSTNSINSPTGTLTADTLVSNITGSDGSWTRQIVSAINGNFNMSIYAKQGTSPFLQVRLDGLGAVIFNLSNGTVKLSSSGIIGSITSVGSDGWYRCSISGAATGQTTALFIVGNSSMNLTTWFATNGDSVYLWGAQFENFATATEYFPTTTRLNIPRIDYTNGSCPSLLVEPQRTNLFTYSNDYSTARLWFPSVAGGSTSQYTLNYGISPDGTQNAGRVQLALNGGPYADWVNVFTVLTIGQTYTYSIYLKSLTSNCSLYFLGDGAANILKNVTTQWVRYTHTFTATTTYYVPRFLIEGGTSTTADILAWGAQLELGSYGTSYVPTVATSVTRNADVISKTGISSLIGQTEGTIYYEFSVPLVENITRALSVSGSDTNNRINISTFSSSIFVRVDVGGANQVNSSAGITVTNMNKVAFRYKANDFSLYVNGVNVITDTSGITFPAATLDRISNIQPDSSSPFNGNIKQVTLFKTALSNTELAQLTTL